MDFGKPGKYCGLLFNKINWNLNCWSTLKNKRKTSHDYDTTEIKPFVEGVRHLQSKCTKQVEKNKKKTARNHLQKSNLTITKYTTMITDWL